MTTVLQQVIAHRIKRVTAALTGDVTEGASGILRLVWRDGDAHGIPGRNTAKIVQPVGGNIVLQVGDRLGLDLIMELGQASERVTVTGEVPLLRTEDVQTGLVIDNRRIQELPQYSRDVLAFALLTPNVQTGPNGTEDLRINGGRTGQTEYFLDGVPMTTPVGVAVGGVPVTVGVEVGTVPVAVGVAAG